MSDFSKGRQSSLNKTNVEWILIQRNTFTNWVNEQLKAKGIVINDLRADFSDGSYLVTLVEVLRRRKLAGHISKPINHYEKLQNITVALDAIANDNVRIINIDSADIAEGNVKLILALIWQLILRYQIGLSNIQHKNWMLAWIQAVIPECNITNFTSDWNDGIALHALIEFCMPGLCPRWRSLKKNERENNCRNAMKTARQQFGIPLILRPEHLASHDLDELSAITYLSYFMKVGAPGYNATLQRIQPIVRNAPVFNFTTDWNDGRVLGELVFNLGGPLDNSSVSSDDGSNIQRIQNALDGAKTLGVEPLLTAAEISEEDTEHLGVMAYAAQFINLKPVAISDYNKYDDQKVIVYDKREFSSTENATSLEVPDSFSFTNGITTEKTTEKYSYKLSGPLNTTSDPYTVTRNALINRNPYSVSGPVKTKTTPYRVSTLEGSQDITKYSISAPVRVAYETNNSYTISNRPVDSGHESISNQSSDVPDLRPTYTVANSDMSVPERKNSYSFIRTPSLRRARKENIELDGVKVDTYSVGLVISIPSFEVYSKDGVHIEAESPSGRVIKMTGDGLYNAQFAPDEIGLWKVGLYCNDKLVETCPVDVCDPSQVKVSGLRSGVVGRKYQFQVDCTKAGNGELEVIINYQNGRVPSYLTKKHEGFYIANFTPFSSGTYHIAVSFNKAEIRDADFLLGEGSDGMHRRAVFQTDIVQMDDYFKVKTACDWQIDYITGSPFEVQISDMSDIKVYSMQDGTICNIPHLIADCSDNPYGKLEAEVSHNGYRFPAKISEEEKPGVYKISFKPRGRGTYKIWVVYDGNMVKGSPFIQEIDELVSPKAYGEGLQRGEEGQPATFTIDARGFEGDLMVNVNGPRYPIKSEVKPQPDGTHKATYIPIEVGPHIINITLDNKDIEGSPFRPRIGNPAKVRISGGWRPLLDENDRIPLIVNKEKQIPFDASEAGSGDLTAEVHGPSSKVPVTVDSRSDKKHTLIFTPKEEGKHYIDVKWNGYPLPNTPYYGYATRLPDEVDSHPHSQPIIVVKNPTHKHKPDHPEGSLIRIKKGPENVYVDQPKIVSQPVMYPVRRYPSSVSSYSQPKVKVVRSPSDAVSSPSVRRINVPKRNSGRSSVVSEPEWTRYQKMPAKYRASSPSSSPNSSRSPSRKENRPSSPDDPTKVILSGKGLKHAEVDKPAVFNVDGRNAGPGEPEATVKSVRASAPVDIKRTGPKYYRCTYVPPVPGAYLLNIKWNKRPLKCCPFKINVYNPVYPSKVDVTGDHLKGGGIVGKDFHINVDPRQAGTGKLTANCTGPNGQNVPVKLLENFDGTHALKMKPVEEGRHILEIRYNGEHVMGSPYAVDIGSDAIKGTVKLYGPGVEDGILPDYQSHFWVDARGAGAGEIHVSLMGPKGAFQVEMRRESQKDKLFHCSYSPHEPGVYTITATWSGKHISESPYKVCIAGSKYELERMIFERDNPFIPVDSFADQKTNTLTSNDSSKDQLMY